MFSCFKKRFFAQILLDRLRPVAIRFLSQIVHGNCLFDELVNWKSFFDGWEPVLNTTICFSSLKRNSQTIVKIDPQLVTGTTCYLHTPFTYLPTLGHLIPVRFGVFRFKPCLVFTRSLRTSFLRDLWLSESPLERRVSHQWRLLGWWPWWLKKEIPIKLQRMIRIWGTNLGDEEVWWQLL